MKKDSMTKALSAEELDAKFDSGEDITEHLDPSSVTRPGIEIKRVNVDLPNHFLEKLD